MGSVVYGIGLVVVAAFILLGIDDLLIDISGFFVKKRLNEESIPFDRLEDVPPRMLGIVIAAWDEAAVISEVITNMVESYHYPRSMYHIFVGVYPNDSPTAAKVSELEALYPNVHLVLGEKDGPTNKADNINQILNHMQDYELRRNCRFASVTVHDAEDIVHPYELRMTNYLIDNHDAIQMPVFPLQRKPTPGNFFSELTRSTYTAEFAENHYRTMAMRNALGGVVPSAGTGFVLTRRVLEYFGNNLFPTGSLTEDYKLSLTLAEHGFRVHYALGKVHRIDAHGNTTKDFVATRSIFPGTFKAAVRQKTRWVFGITMQSAGLKDVLAGEHEAGLAERLSVLKDMKAKIANLMVLPGYMLLGYFIVSLFVPLPEMFPAGSLSSYLSLVLMAMMAERQYTRALALGHVYGWRHVVRCCLVPPVLPLSLVWGNVINYCATVLAWRQNFFGSVPAKKAGGKRRTRVHKWAKTDHEFPRQETLENFRCDLQDVLLRRGLASADDISSAMKSANGDSGMFEKLLLQSGGAAEEDLARAIAQVEHTIFLGDLSRFIFSSHVPEFAEQELREHCMLPLLSLKKGVVYALPIDDLRPTLKHVTLNHGGMGYVVSTREAIQKGIDELYGGVHSKPTPLIELVREGRVSWQQGVLAVDFQPMRSRIEEYMGIYVPKAVVPEIDHTEMARLFDAI